MKKALITGIIGQDGSYLAELLLSKGYEAHGMVRRSPTFNTGRINRIYRDPQVINKTNEILNIVDSQAQPGGARFDSGVMS